MTFNVKILPREDAANGWTAILPARAPAPALTGERQADWAVLGAGFTGLAAARRLSVLRPDARIAIVDAGLVGEGASGRNSGFAIDHAHALGGEKGGPDAMRSEKRLYTEAIRTMREIVTEHRIDCDWRESGKYHAAVSKKGAEKILKPLVAQLEEAGEAHRWCDRDEMAAALGIEAYEAGVYTPGTVLVNPAALVRGLADALPENVTLYENTPVVRIENAGNGVALYTEHGRLEAGGLIIAANAYTPSVGFFRRQLLPLIAFASLTRPMTPEEEAALGGAPSWGVTPADGFVSPTLQRTGDNRILFRYGIFYRPRLRHDARELEAERARHADAFAKRFTMLPALSLDHCWGGYLCASANQHSAFGRAGETIWAAAGFQGVGVTRGTIAGMLIADVALGEANPLIADMEKIASPAVNPPQPLLKFGVEARMMWNRFASRHEY